MKQNKYIISRHDGCENALSIKAKDDDMTMTFHKRELLKILMDYTEVNADAGYEAVFVLKGVTTNGQENGTIHKR